MGKSYWFKDWPSDDGQRGNFSNKKQDTFNPKDGFIGVRLQQGIPLLDRDWNELEDIRRYQEVMLRKNYLGNGTPNDGFRIFALDPPANDFMISAGSFLVDGFEAINNPDGADSIRYSSQPSAPPLKEVPPGSPIVRSDTVYLDVWIEEVTSTDPGQDRLKNSDDVAMETCIRHRLRWYVWVDEGSKGHKPDEGHHFYDLAKIIRIFGKNTILSTDIEDLRSTWQSLEVVQSRLRNAINCITSGNMPSDPMVDLIKKSTPIEYVGTRIIKDNAGNMIIFWWQDAKWWAKRYSASTRTWDQDFPLTTENSYLNAYSFVDSKGDVWFFCYQYGGPIWAGRYSFSDARWVKGEQITSASVTQIYYKICEDKNKKIWIFWYQVDGYIYVSKYSTGSWSKPEQIANGTIRDCFSDSNGTVWLLWEEGSNIYKSRRYIGDTKTDWTISSDASSVSSLECFEDAKGNVWFFWIHTDKNSLTSVRSNKFTSMGWEGETQIITWNKGNWFFFTIHSINDVWFFWLQADVSYYNIWSKRYTSNVWGNEVKVTNEENGVRIEDYFATPNGDIWLIYDQLTTYDQDIVADRFAVDDQWESKNLTSFLGEDYAPRFINGSRIALSDGNLAIVWQDWKSGITWSSIFNKNLNYHTKLESEGMNIPRIFEKTNGEIWFLYQKGPYENLWCSRFIDGSWMREERLINDTNLTNVLWDILEDASGDIWVFWMAQNSTILRYKRIYGSV